MFRRVPRSRPAGTRDPARASRGRFPATRCRRRPSSAARTTPARRAASPRAPARRRCASPSTRCTTMPAFSSPARGPNSTSRGWPPAARRVARRETREVDDAEQVAADVRDAEEPRPRQRHRDDLGQRHHLAGVGQPDEPALAAAGQARAATIPPARPSWSRAGRPAPAGTCGGRVWRRGPWCDAVPVSRSRRSSRAARRGSPASRCSRARPGACPRSCRSPGSSTCTG